MAYYVSRHSQALKLTLLCQQTNVILNFVEKYVRLMWKKGNLLLLWLSLLNMLEYYVKIILYKKYSEYERVLNMGALNSVLNIPKYAMSEFWIYLGF